jgi:hypothetical protein
VFLLNISNDAGSVAKLFLLLAKNIEADEIEEFFAKVVFVFKDSIEKVADVRNIGLKLILV